MYRTNTKTSTYTVIDIRKTFESCHADIRTIARRTGKWSMEYVDEIFHDVLELAENYYLKSLDIVLMDKNTEKALMASKFIINSEGMATSSDRAGNNNDWVDIADTYLTVIISYTDKWSNLSNDQKSKFYRDNDFKISWTSSRIDNSFPHLKSNEGQLYASKGYELQKNNYR